MKLDLDFFQLSIYANQDDSTCGVCNIGHIFSISNLTFVNYDMACHK